MHENWARRRFAPTHNMVTSRILCEGAVEYASPLQPVEDQPLHLEGRFPYAPMTGSAKPGFDEANEAD